MNSCNVCGAREGEVVFIAQNTHGEKIVNSDEFGVFRCDNCGNHYLKGLKTGSGFFEKYYDFSLFYRSDLKKEKGKARKNRNLLYEFLAKSSFWGKRRLTRKALKKLGKSRVKLLDVGCGSGNKYLGLLKNERLEKYGVEIDERFAKRAKKFCQKVYVDDFVKVDFKEEKFDIITMWHVLEHILDPTAFLKKAYGVINKDGYLIVSVPNSDSLGFRLGKKWWFHLDSPRHLYIPNWQIMQKMLKRAGFSIVKTKNSFYEYLLDLFWSVRNSAWKWAIYPFYPFFKLASSETITIVAKKK